MSFNLEIVMNFASVRTMRKCLWQHIIQGILHLYKTNYYSENKS